jgi:SAM-dependent methyltransferase
VFRSFFLLSSVSFLPIVVLGAQTPAVPVYIPYADARSILDVFRSDLLPVELRAIPLAEREAIWPRWVAGHDATIRARLTRADEDSLLNLLLLGTMFTQRPRVELASVRTREAALERLGGRVDDLIAALAAPRDERLRFARDVVAGSGIDPDTPQGRKQVREYLLAILARVVSETEQFARTVAAISQLDDPVAKLAIDATNYQNRGLSSDTSLAPGFAIEQALANRDAARRLGPASVRRVAVVGPGLDIIDRRDGYDFYPVQTIQPFAVIDSLLRLDLADRGQLQVTTFDVSPRVNGHLAAARRQAENGRGYTIHLPLGSRERWSTEVNGYWERFGNWIGDADDAEAPADSGVRLRAVHVHPDVVRSVVPHDLNIVLQRLEALPPAEQFDLVIATNVFIYYDVFEQSLALANVARMLRPGGLLLSNTLLNELPGLPMTRVAHADVVYTETAVGDRIMVYELAGSR